MEKQHEQYSNMSPCVCNSEHVAVFCNAVVVPFKKQHVFRRLCVRDVSGMLL